MGYRMCPCKTHTANAYNELTLESSSCGTRYVEPVLHDAQVAYCDLMLKHRASTHLANHNRIVIGDVCHCIQVISSDLGKAPKLRPLSETPLSCAHNPHIHPLSYHCHIHPLSYCCHRQLCHTVMSHNQQPCDALDVISFRPCSFVHSAPNKYMYSFMNRN